MVAIGAKISRRWRGAVRLLPRGVRQPGVPGAQQGGAVHPEPREARQWLIPLVGVNLVGADVYADVVDAPLEVNDGILEPVDAVVERGVSTVVLV